MTCFFVDETISVAKSPLVGIPKVVHWSESRGAEPAVVVAPIGGAAVVSLIFEDERKNAILRPLGSLLHFGFLAPVRYFYFISSSL